ncbi:MAG: LptF/LptG family permease, partial [Pseudomonadota bacterium]
VSTMLTFRQLSRRAELPVIRASGLSAWRFLRPPVLLAILVGLATMAIISPAGSRLSEIFEEQRAELLGNAVADINVFPSGIWLRSGDDTMQTVIHAKSIDRTGTILRDVKFIEETRQFENGTPTSIYTFRRRIDAAEAQLADGFWQLEDIVENVPGGEPRHLFQLALPTSVKQDSLIDKFASPTTIGFWALPERIEQTRTAGLNALRYEMRWHNLTALPALFTAMTLIGAIACLRLARLGGTARLAATAAIAAIGLYFVSQLSSSLSATGAVPPIVTAWGPPLFAIFVCLSIVAFREDG